MGRSLAIMIGKNRAEGHERQAVGWVSLRVEVDELHAVGTQIAAAVSAPGALAGAEVPPAAGDQVSVGVASALSACFGVIAAHSAQGAHVAGTAAGVLHANAATYQQQEDLNSAALRPEGAPAPAAASVPASGGRDYRPPPRRRCRPRCRRYRRRGSPPPTER